MQKIKPENFFLICAFIIGCVLVLITPLGAGYDEETHLARIWEISAFKLIPNSLFNEGPQLPSIFMEVSYRQRKTIKPISFEEQFNFNNKIDASNMTFYKTRSTYFPSSYLLQAFIIGLLGRIGNANINSIYFLIRFSYLLLYIGLVFLSIKLIPFGKWLLTFGALTPMALIQASIISPDSIVNAGSFLFIAWVFYLKFRQPTKVINTKDIGITLLLSFILCSVKPNNLVFLLLLFLIPTNLFKNKQNKIIFIVSDILLMLTIYLFWYYLVSLNNAIFDSSEEVNVFAQIKFIIKNPLYFFNVLFQTLRGNWKNYLQCLVGVFGYHYYALPNFVYALYFLGFLIFSFFYESEIDLNKKDKRIIFSLILLFILCTFLIFYCMANQVGSPTIDGVQGRYFIPLIPLILFILPKRKTIKNNILANSIKSVYLSLLGISLVLSIYFGYYVTCGIPKLNGQVCSLPKYKNWDVKSNAILTLEPEQTITQSILPECEAITSISLLNESAYEGNSTLSIEIKDQSSNLIYFTQQITLHNLGKDDFIKINFNEPIHAKNDGLLVQIKNASSQNLFLGTFNRDEYTDGALYVNNEEKNYDLIFKYTCQ